MKIMIKTFDENLALKSNKKDIWKIENDLRIYATTADLAKLEEDTDEEVLKLRQELDTQRDVVEGFQSNLQMTVFDAVKKAKKGIEK